MVETGGSPHCQQHSPWESSAFKNCMIAPAELRQYDSLPASVNPYKGSANLGLHGFEFHGLPEKGLAEEANGLIGKSWPYPQNPFLNAYGYPKEQSCPFSVRADAQPSAYESSSCPREKRFLIFDQTGDQTRMIFSPLCPWLQNPTTVQTNKYPAWNPLDASPGTYFGANQFPTEGQAKKAEQVWTKAPILCEESGENEIVGEGSGMREDTEEINALLYSDNDDDDDDGFDSNSDGHDDDEMSTGHSPLAMGGDCKKVEGQEERDFHEVDSSDRPLKRQKTLDGGDNELSLLHETTMSRENLSYENIHSGDTIYALDEQPGPPIGKKRMRKEKIRDILRALEGIIPGVKSNDPLIILDEAISYLKCLKYNAQVMSMEDRDPDCSGCYEPSN